jgi:hypothetical protein
MANIQSISYQTSAAVQNLDVTDHKFGKAAAKVDQIARQVFNIQEGSITASITADRIVIVHNALTHTLQLANGQLTADGQPIAEDSIYHSFGYLQGLLKIEALPIAQIAQPSLAPSITRSPDGNTVNITLNMGNTSLDSGRHVEELTKLVKSSFEAALGAQQRNIDTLSAENARLKTSLELIPQLEWRLAEFQRQQRESEAQHLRETERLATEAARIPTLSDENTRLTTVVIPQFEGQIADLQRQQRESEARYLEQIERLKAEAERLSQDQRTQTDRLLAELNAE